MRLDKYLSLAMLGTRKKVKEYIYAGNAKVNNETILNPDFVVSNHDEILYMDNIVKSPKKVYYAFNKPKGYITARSDDRHETIFNFFHEIDTTGLFPVGRLDKDTEGLLIITNDGAFDQMLMHPNNHIEKTYYLIANGIITDEKIKLLENGLDIGYEKITKPSKFQLISTKENSFEATLSISQGMKHQVKRMIKAVGCEVTYLKRISIGNLNLEKDLKIGEYRLLNDNEIEMFYNKV